MGAAKAAAAARARAAEDEASRQAEEDLQQETVGAEDLSDTDGLFSSRRGKKRRRVAGADASETVAPPVAATPSVSTGDSDLQEALQLIAGRAPARVRKARRKRAAAVAAATGANQSDSDDAAAELAPKVDKEQVPVIA